MYEPTSEAMKQTGAMLQHPGASGVLFQAPSTARAAAAGQYVTMVSRPLYSVAYPEGIRLLFATHRVNYIANIILLTDSVTGRFS